MNKQICSNRWFIWAIVFIVVVGVGLWGFIEYTNITTDIKSTEDNIVFTVVIPKQLIGGETDEHGCVLMGGYTWCEAKQKCLREWEEPCEAKKEITKNDLIFSLSSVQGMSSVTYLFGNGTFIKINEMTQISNNEEPQCYEGEISLEAYDSFVEFIESVNFFETEMIQKDETGLICEGAYNVRANIGDQNNSLWSPCVSEQTELTEKNESIMIKISEELGKITSVSKQVCRQGGFIKTSDVGSCSYYEVEYQTYNLSDLHPILKESLAKEGAYVYVGPVDETIKSYHRKYYEIGDTCYFVFLNEFDGNLFNSYDLHSQ